MASPETQYPGTTAFYNGWHGWTAWAVGPTEVEADDGSYAQGNLNVGQKSRALRGYNFGFALTGATGINSIKMYMERKLNASGPTGSMDYFVHFCSDASSNAQAAATKNATNKASGDTWTTSDVVYEYDLAPDAMYSIAQVTNSNFGFIFDFYNTAGSPGTYMVDYVKITVDYAVAGAVPVMSHHYTKNIGAR